tara:strand:+ start:925 stop:1098 length:174 start_codon:yes stop_codon:yes gene_type:complete
VVKEGNKNIKDGEKEKSYEEIKREAYLAFLAEEKENQLKNEAEKFKTLDCVMKIMDY